MTPALNELLDVMEVEHDGTLPSIIQETQKSWLRPAGKERWEVSDIDPEKRSRVIELADELGFIRDIHPQAKEYDYCLILGATVGRMELRLQYVASLWEEGIRFKHMVFLTGERPLDPAIETLSDHYRTETEAAHYLWENNTLPNELKSLPITFVDVPMFATEKGWRRPTTQDTLVAWIKLSPEPGSCLSISNQPFCPYQHETVLHCLPPGFTLETVGPGGQIESQHGAVILDSIARWLYQSTLNTH